MIVEELEKKCNLTHFFPVLKPGGGPSGYLYNLYSLKKKSTSHKFDISFHEIINDRITLTINDGRFSRVLEFPIFTRKLFIAVYYLSKVLSPFRSFRIYKKVKDYDSVVFHSFFDLVNYCMYFSRFKKQKLLFMPHNPEMHYQEILSNLATGAFNIDKFKFLRCVLKYFEKRSFIRASALIFPTEFSYEGYEKEFLDVILKKDKIYIPSTVVAGHVGPVEEIEELGSEKLNILYVGRFNEIKGFNLFINAAIAFESSFNFICVGSGPLDKLIPENVLNLGWRSDIFSILSQSDYVVVPNKKTYFDLLPIEALLSGCSLLLSNVGGNKYLIQKGRESVRGFSNLDELYGLLSELKRVVSIDRRGSIDIYNELFSPKKFLEKHDSLSEII